jgi:hypothetical protein
MARNRRTAPPRPAATQSPILLAATQALGTIAPDAAGGYERAKDAARAATSKLGKKGRVAMALAGLALAAGLTGATVGVARRGAAQAASAMLGPQFHISCQLPSGRFGVCPWDKR